CVRLIAWCFFFQAEDGIRDRNVTGVQTCALPIFGFHNISCRGNATGAVVAVVAMATGAVPGKELRALGEGIIAEQGRGAFGRNRSEERRVGKECRGWRWR